MERFMFCQERPSKSCRIFVLVLVGVTASLTAGCKHRRSSMRPIFAGPPATVVVPAEPCPSGNCGSTSAYSPGFEDGSLSPAPAAVPLPPLDSSVAPQSLGEPSLDPDLLPGDNGLSPTSRAPRNNTLRETRGASPAPARSGSLRSQIAPFVNDPNDLFEPPRADRPWQYIVMHHSAGASGSYEAIDRAHREQMGTAGCGYHFVIGNGSQSPDGQIEVTSRWSEQRAGAHARDARTPAVNEYGIGICLVGNLDQEPPTPRQIEAARILVSYLRERYAIPSERTGSHAQLAQNPTACPGKHFPAEAVLGNRKLAFRENALHAHP